MMSHLGIESLKRGEALRLESYQLIGEAHHTIGWGHYGPDVLPEMTITRARAEELLAKDLERFEHAVMELNSQRAARSLERFNVHEYDALVRFAFNIGVARFRTSSLYAQALKIRSPHSAEIACRLMEWTLNGSGTRSEGIINRRIETYRMFTLGEYT